MKKFQQHITYFLLAVFTASQFYLSFHFLAIDHEYLINDFSAQESYVQELKLTSLKSHECSIFHLWKNNWLILNAETNYELATDKQNRGTINSFMLRDIEIAYITSGISAQQAAYNLMESKVALLKITGGIMQDLSK